MQENQDVSKKTSHPMVAKMLARIEANNQFDRTAEPLKSISGVLVDEQHKQATQACKLYTPTQNAMLQDVQEKVYQIGEWLKEINHTNAVWNLDLPKMGGEYEVGEMLAAIEDKVRMLHRIAKEKGVNPVLDNKAGASQHKAYQQRQAELKHKQQAINTHYQNKRQQYIQAQGENHAAH